MIREKITITLNTLTTLGVIALLVYGFLLYKRYPKGIEGAVAEYWEKRGFKTDTIHVEVDYDKLPKPEFKYVVPPAKVYNYPIPKTPGVEVEMDEHYIRIIDSLQNEITKIHKLYLTYEPRSSKLLWGSFTRDSLRVDLLDITGNIQTLSYGVNYNRFSYQWREGHLEANPVSYRNPWRTEAFVFGGYDIAFGTPIIGGDYSIYKGRFRLKGSSFITIEQQPTYSLQANLGYRLR